MKTYIVYCPDYREDINNCHEINAINHNQAALAYAYRHGISDLVKSALVFVVDISSRLEWKIRAERCGDLDYSTYIESEPQS